jgi:hypothetical protein
MTISNPIRIFFIAFNFDTKVGAAKRRYSDPGHTAEKEGRNRDYAGYDNGRFSPNQGCLSRIMGQGGTPATSLFSGLTE